MMQISDQSSDQVFDAAMNALWRCTEKFAQYNDDTEDNGMLGTLHGIMESYCMLDMHKKASAESFDEVKQAEVSDKTFRELYEEVMVEKKRTLPSAREHKKYKAYQKKVEALTRKDKVPDIGDDEDLMITQADVNTIDPISRQQMVSPVKNKICGHSYDKRSIIALFRNKREQMCPCVGCPSRKRFTMNDLEEDFELKQIIKRQRIQ